MVSTRAHEGRGEGERDSVGGALTRRPKTQNSSTNSDEERSRGKTRRRSAREAAKNTKEETRRRSAHEVGTRKRRQRLGRSTMA